MTPINRMDSFLRGEKSLAEYLAELAVNVDALCIEWQEQLSRRDMSYDFVWTWCKAALLFGHSRKLTSVICTLLERDDHQGHEDLAETLQDLRDPISVDCLYDRALRPLPYLDYNDSAALRRKCVWALHDIGTPEAVAKLKLLAKDDIVATDAMERLVSLDTHRIGDPIPPYRLARDSKLGSL